MSTKKHPGKEEILIDLDQGEFYIKDLKRWLTPAEIKLLKILKRREGKPVPVDLLEDELCKDPNGNSFTSVSYHISKLRAKLGHSKDNPIINTKPGIGYTLINGAVNIYSD